MKQLQMFLSFSHQSSQRVFLWEVNQEPWAVEPTQQNVVVAVYWCGNLAKNMLLNVPQKNVVSLTASLLPLLLQSTLHWPSTTCPGLTPSTWRSSGCVIRAVATQSLPVKSLKSMVSSHIILIFFSIFITPFHFFPFSFTDRLEVLPKMF